MTIYQYFHNNSSIVSLQFTNPQEVHGYSCNNFVLDSNYLHLLSDSGKIEYLIPSSTEIDKTDDGFVLRNKFFPNPILVQVFFGGAQI